MSQASHNRFHLQQKINILTTYQFLCQKVISTINCMKILGNSSRDLIPTQKRLLYRYCILLIAFYGFQPWYYNKAPLLYPLKILQSMQRRAVLQIVGVFCTLPTSSIKTIAGLIPIHLHIQKLNGRFYLRTHSLPSNHIINSMLEARSLNHANLHCFSLEQLTSRQQLNIKGSIVDINNRFNENFPLFSHFNCKFSPENKLIDISPK